MTISTVAFDDGKYEFDLDGHHGVMLAARRHGEPWHPGEDLRMSKVFMAALWRIQDLEAQASDGDFSDARRT